jgi:hypothetical protein
VTKTQAIWKPSRNSKAGFNALAVDSDSDGEENRSQPLEGVKSHLSGKVKVCFVPLELESGDSDSTMEKKNRNSENVRNSSKKNTKVTQSVDLDDNIKDTKVTQSVDLDDNIFKLEFNISCNEDQECDLCMHEVCIRNRRQKEMIKIINGFNKLNILKLRRNVRLVMPKC